MVQRTTDSRETLSETLSFRLTPRERQLAEAAAIVWDCATLSTFARQSLLFALRSTVGDDRGPVPSANDEPERRR